MQQAIRNMHLITLKNRLSISRNKYYLKLLSNPKSKLAKSFSDPKKLQIKFKK